MSNYKLFKKEGKLREMLGMEKPKMYEGYLLSGRKIPDWLNTAAVNYVTKNHKKEAGDPWYYDDEVEKQTFISGATSPEAARYHQDFSGCPCEYLDEPCMPRCTCKIGGSSAGCMYCATYGSLEQRKEAAKRISEWIKTSKRYHQEPVYEMSEKGLEHFTWDFLYAYLKNNGYSSGSEEQSDKLVNELKKRQSAAMEIILNGKL